ncbi:FtsK/SpoIIIE domain-containing protein [Cryobacterium zongtaii]|nr:FtsK/SpoIIIE domain-containing protein [Cryobacterium zongtaii]
MSWSKTLNSGRGRRTWSGVGSLGIAGLAVMAFSPMWLRIVLALAALLVASAIAISSHRESLRIARVIEEKLWESADSESLRIVRILRAPGALNQHLFQAKLFHDERLAAEATALKDLGKWALGSEAIERIELFAERRRTDTIRIGDKTRFVPKIVAIERSAVGPVALFTAIPGATENTYDFASDVLEVSMRVQEIRVEQRPEDRANGLMRMTFVVHDPLQAPSGSTFFEAHAASTPLLLPLAITEEGGVYSLPVHHTLIVGATGSGKGGVIQSLLRQLAPWQRAGQVRLFGADPKRAELKGFEMSSLFDLVAFDVGTIAEMVESLVNDVLRPRQRSSGRSFTLSSENPLVVLVIDELSSLAQDRNFAKSGLSENLNLILSQGRSDGVYVIAASQVGHKEVLGGLRQHFANRIALRVDTAIEVDMILGAGALACGAKPHEIPVANDANSYRTAGIAYVRSDESPRLLRIRFPYTSDEDIQKLLQADPR